MPLQMQISIYVDEICTKLNKILLLGLKQATSVLDRHLLRLILAASLTNLRIHRARIVPVCLYQAMSTTHFGRLRSFIGIYCARYVKWGTPDRDGILVLAQQIKQIKIQIFLEDVSHALTSQWPPSGSCDRFRDLFLYCPPTQAPVLTVFRICFYLNPTAKHI